MIRKNIKVRALPILILILVLTSIAVIPVEAAPPSGYTEPWIDIEFTDNWATIMITGYNLFVELPENHEVTIYWDSTDYPIEPDPQTFQYIYDSDSGTYTCIATFCIPYDVEPGVYNVWIGITELEMFEVYSNQVPFLLEQGLQGLRGLIGFAGERGLQGLQGIAGETGDTGPAGPEGDVGPAGEQGLAGEPGPEGEQGAVGEQGLMGDQGLPGPDGKDYSSTGVSIAALSLVLLVIAFILFDKIKNWVAR